MPQPLDGKFHGIIHRNKDGRYVPPECWMAFMVWDRCFLPTLRFYREECERQGAHQYQLTAVDELIRRVEKWQAEHPEKMKLPDVERGELSW